LVVCEYLQYLRNAYCLLDAVIEPREHIRLVRDECHFIETEVSERLSTGSVAV